MKKRDTSLDKNPNTNVLAKSLVAQRLVAKQFDSNNRTRTSSAISGVHNSIFKGRGMDYQESRAYTAGDDIRNMDWKVTAKTGKPHIKLFQEERERPTYIIISSNLSMFFGTKKQFKSVLAANIASLLAWHSIQKGDRIALVSYGHLGINFHRPVSGKNGVMKLISGLVKGFSTKKEQPELDNITNASLGDTLKQIKSIIKPGSNIIIISDFHNLNGSEKMHLSTIKKHNDILAICVSDPFELTKPANALYGLKSNHKSIVFNTKNKDTQQIFSDFRNGLINNLNNNFIQIGIPIIPIQTDYDYISELITGYQNPRLAYTKWITKLSEINKYG